MSNRDSSTPEVVITGLGVVSPIGIGAEPFEQNVLAGKSGVAPISMFAATAAPDNIGGEIKDFNDETAKKIHLKEKELRKSLKLMCREIQLGVASAMQAIAHSGLNLAEIDHERLGVEFGANLMLSDPVSLGSPVHAAKNEEGKFHFEHWGERGLTSMEPLWLLKYLPNMPACHIGITTDARGPNNSLTLEDASANTVIGEALRIIQRGAADIMITGSTGTILHPIRTLHVALWKDLLARSPAEPERRSRPFDRDRTGMVVAEGAGTFILETRAHAEKRGAKVYGRVLGSGSSCVATRQGEAQFRPALANAMSAALRSAGLKPEDIGHVNAHGLGTKEMDRLEAAAIHDVFGAYAEKVPVTAVKSLMGNAGAGSGMVELAASIVALNRGYIPPTLNYENPDPEIKLNVVSGEPQKTDNKYVLAVNVSRKGQAAAVVVEAA